MGGRVEAGEWDEVQLLKLFLCRCCCRLLSRRKRWLTRKRGGQKRRRRFGIGIGLPFNQVLLSSLPSQPFRKSRSKMTVEPWGRRTSPPSPCLLLLPLPARSQLARRLTQPCFSSSRRRCTSSFTVYRCSLWVYSSALPHQFSSPAGQLQLSPPLPFSLEATQG